MVTLSDVSGAPITKIKYGFKLDLTATALDYILREKFNMPKGEPVRVVVNNETLLLSIIYNSDKPYIDEKFIPGKISECGEYPSRGYKKTND